MSQSNCPKCGANIVGTQPGGDVVCPRCAHTFQAEGPPPPAPVPAKKTPVGLYLIGAAVILAILLYLLKSFF